MIDIHSHVLPGVDDGARDTEEAIDMLRIMYDEGVTEAILTPHYHRGHMQKDIATVKSRFDELSYRAKEDDKASKIKLHLGCELYYYPSAVEWLEEGRVSSMAGSDYVLLEFGYTMEKRAIVEGVSNVVRAGYIPILAHVERYEGLGFKTANIRELIEYGAYIQVNSEAVGRGFGAKKFVRKLFKEDLVHFVATDAHDTKGRRPRLKKAARYVHKHFGEEVCRRIFIENPARICD
ncbi:MAG: hypothetical protein K6G67_07550 [Lachnospiraceae bacterium]|jgi:protein-tyrosine phosphatase|nr:hypothetical protein [Lachnospiraceae bacterium]